MLVHLGKLPQKFNLFIHQALKIKDKDPFIWTRLGFVEYEVFKDLNMAKQCFEAAVSTCSTFERRSSKINVILVKLAEGKAELQN